jgi:phosphohistidine phosphatase SixA
MKIVQTVIVSAALALLVTLAWEPTSAQNAPAAALLAPLRQGGLVLVMRHASSPRDVPTRQTADPANTTLERELDAAGRTTATAMGTAIRELKIPIGEVFTSGTFRALQTVRLAQLGMPTIVAELGDGGRSMQAATDAQSNWLRTRITQVPARGNAVVVTHMPNLSRAFPEWGAVDDGETVVVKPDGKGGSAILGRIKIEAWKELR